MGCIGLASVVARVAIEVAMNEPFALCYVVGSGEPSVTVWAAGPNGVQVEESDRSPMGVAGAWWTATVRADVVPVEQAVEELRPGWLVVTWR